MVTQFFKTHLRPWAPRRRVVVGATVALVAILSARWWLDIGPQQSNAADMVLRSTGPFAACIQPRIKAVGVRELSSNEWDLVFDLEWKCPSSRVGIESAAGWLRVWPASEPDKRLQLACILYSPVTPGHPIRHQLTTIWDDLDPIHETIRRTEPSQLRAVFVPEEAVLADRTRDDNRPRVLTTPGQSAPPKSGSNPWVSRKAPAKALPR